MGPSPCILWQEPDSDAANRLPALIRQGLRAGSGNTKVFFRADDIGPIDQPFGDMIELFRAHQAPLGLALVPTWLDAAGWHAMLELCGDRELWTWHQHGYSHLNHETQGKKQEFGPARPAEEKERDLVQGWEHLEALLGKRLSPIFTPPWNRLDPEALQLLKKLGFKAVSRDFKPKVPPIKGLLELPVVVDPHTRKETNPKQAWADLENELVVGMSLGLCGIMLHHELMNQSALDWLAALLDALSAESAAELASMADLLSK